MPVRRSSPVSDGETIAWAKVEWKLNVGAYESVLIGCGMEQILKPGDSPGFVQRGLLATCKAVLEAEAKDQVQAHGLGKDPGPMGLRYGTRRVSP